MYSATEARNIKRAQSCTGRERRETAGSKRGANHRGPRRGEEIYTQRTAQKGSARAHRRRRQKEHQAAARSEPQGAGPTRDPRATGKKRAREERPREKQPRTGNKRRKAARGTRRTEKPHSAAETSRKGERERDKDKGVRGRHRGGGDVGRCEKGSGRS